MNALYENDVARFENALGFYDLADYFTHKTTGYKTRSLCTVTCKWLFEKGEFPSIDYYHKIGFKNLTQSDINAKFGDHFLPPGAKIGEMTENIKKELGFETTQNISVASSLIDAHAGGFAGISLGQSLEKTMVIIAGTSACHMSVSKSPKLINGIWGPYHHAMIPEYHLNEAGQSAVGSAIDDLLKQSKLANPYKEIEDISEKDVFSCEHLHFYPDVHGNRSPIGDPKMTGVLAGITLDTSLRQKYISLVQGLALQTKQILVKLGGNLFDTIVVTGGVTKNRFFMQTLADVCGVQVFCTDDCVLIGTAMLAKQAARGLDVSLESLLPKIDGQFFPNVKMERYYLEKWEVYLKLQEISSFIAGKK